jgi:hypothetical protein
MSLPVVPRLPGSQHSTTPSPHAPAPCQELHHSTCSPLTLCPSTTPARRSASAASRWMSKGRAAQGACHALSWRMGAGTPCWQPSGRTVTSTLPCEQGGRGRGRRRGRGGWGLCALPAAGRLAGLQGAGRQSPWGHSPSLSGRWAPGNRPSSEHGCPEGATHRPGAGPGHVLSEVWAGGVHHACKQHTHAPMSAFRAARAACLQMRTPTHCRHHGCKHACHWELQGG